jgi:hypothetical protein
MNFDDWFSKQVGTRPSSISTPHLIRQAREHEEEAKRIREMVTKVNEWEAQRSIARTAWLAARGGRE